jgi:putative acetyltransferase
MMTAESITKYTTTKNPELAGFLQSLARHFSHLSVIAQQMITNRQIRIIRQTAWSPEAQQMLDELWNEIQARYHFQSPNMIDFTEFVAPRSAFWLAFLGNTPVGSVGVKPFDDTCCELDAMYVKSEHRGKGIATNLMSSVEAFMRETGFKTIKLRTGQPQPEALSFYKKMGFHPIKPFGKWKNDPTALCFEKQINY